jgi:hypothetical protein
MTFKAGDIIKDNYSDNNNDYGLIIESKQKIQSHYVHLKVIYFNSPNEVYDYNTDNATMNVWFKKVE